MTSIEIVKNRLIDRILVTQNQELLEAVDKLFTSTQREEIFNLSSDQVELLLMSEQDIASGNIVSEKDLKMQDVK
jgi:hypothetical protein